MRLLTRITATLLLLAVCCTAYPQQSYLRYHDLMDLRASAQAVPNMTVKVASGIADITGLQVTYAGGNSPTFTAPGATNRIDLLTIDSAGTLAITEGAAAASPTPPAYPAWKLPICEVYLKSTSTSIVSYNDGASAHGYIYADVRPVLQMAMVNPTTHALLSLTHSDTTAAAAAVGAIITGQTGPVWAELTLGSAGKILRSDGTNLVYGDVLYPASTTQYRVLYSSASNTLADDANLTWIPASGLSATVSDDFPATLTRTTTATNDAEPSLLIRRATSSDMADGFGVRIGTKVADATSGFLNFGSIGWIRDGADATSKFVLRLPAAGVVADRLTVDATGKLTVAAATVGSLTGYIKGTTGVLSQQTGVPWADITDPPGTYPATAHAILSATHSDATPAAVVRGATITGQGETPKWSILTIGGAGKILRSDGTDLLYTTATYPATTTANQLLYSSSDNVIGGLTSGNSSVLVTNGNGVPSLATDIPTAVTIGTKYIYRAEGTDVAVADGGTNLSTVAAGSILAANALNTLTAITSTSDTKVLQNAAGTISWASTAAPGAHSLLSASHGDTAVGTVLRGDLVTGQTASPAWTRLALGTVGKVLRSDGTDVAWSAVTLPASTTSGRVLYSTGTSALGDDADLTFDGAGLQVGTAFSAVSQAPIEANANVAGVTYPLMVRNIRHANDTASQVGLKLQLGGADTATELKKWVGVVAYSASNYEATSGIDFYTHDTAANDPTAKMRLTAAGALQVGTNTAATAAGQISADRHYLNATAYLDGANAGRIGVSGTIDAFSMTAANSLTFSAGNIVTDTTTGTKIGTGATQKLGFFNATPVVQPTGDVATALSALGLVASPTIAGGTGSFLGMYVHTSGTTHTTGATCHTIIVELIGGGGGGGGAKSDVNQGSAGAGGGSGGYARKTFAVNPSTGYTYAVGAAGAAGNKNPGPGGDGGNTTFAVGATTVTAYGGSGGPVMASGATVTARGGGTGGIVSVNGDVNATGEGGQYGLRTGTTGAISGSGGSSYIGAGGASVGTGDGGFDGIAGGQYGTGGSGAASFNANAGDGGAGAAGVAIVWEFT